MKQLKHLLLSVALVFGSYCFGQKKDSITVIGTGSGLVYDRAWAIPGNRIHEFTITPKQDTIKCLMLVCDTSMKNDFGKRLTLSESVWRVERRWSEGVWWQYGYEVKGWNQNVLYFDKEGNIIEYDYRTYLDQNKKALPSSIVVWLTKEIK